MSKVEIDLGQLVNSCFVIMPFSAVFNAEYTNVICPAIESSGLKPVRADEIYSKPQVTADIWKSLKSSRIVIAELSNRNINVFYEVGLAHALGKPVIIITRNEEDVPFDLKALRYLYYDTNNPSWGENLKKALGEMIQGILKETEFGTVFEGIRTIGNMEYQKIPISHERIVYQNYNLSGLWEGEINVGSKNILVKLDISQKDSDLSATMTSCNESGDKTVIVQESLKGLIIKDVVTLYGVSYTFIQQGMTSEYPMDSFSGKILDGDNTIKGTVSDESNNRGTFSLTRVKKTVER